jgi:CheY-like chemotaxis protein
MRKTILLVDDDPDFLEQNRMLLEANGYAVRTASSGRECLAAVEAGRPDLVILDMVMGERQEGFDVSRELRNSEYTKGIPLVMITSVNDATPFRIEPDRTWLPVDALIEKPVDPLLLLSVVQRICGGAAGGGRPAGGEQPAGGSPSGPSPGSAT